MCRLTVPSPMPTPEGGIASIQVNDIAAKVLDPQQWIDESFAFATQYAYASPISHGATPVMLTREYETNARTVARTQAALAAMRLANILNEALR